MQRPIPENGIVLLGIPDSGVVAFATVTGLPAASRALTVTNSYPLALSAAMARATPPAVPWPLPLAWDKTMEPGLTPAVTSRA